MSADTAISLEHVGKRYVIRHLAGNRPSNFRELITHTLRKPLALFRNTPNTTALQEDLWALKDVTFEVKRGEVIGIIGRNGAGKSTLLKLLSRVTEPTTGRITLRGRVTSLLEVGTGFHPELTGRENIFLNAAILGMRREEILRKFDEIVAFAGVESFIDTPVKHYSSGMYVRLAFSVAAHVEPDILIVDEVLAVGDINFQKKCLGKMEDVANKKGRTVLFVSHNMGAISALTKRALRLEGGMIAAIGDTGEIVSHYLANVYEKQSAWRAEQRTDKPLQITGVILRDKAGRAQTDFEASEGLAIEVEYEVRRAIKNHVVELYIHTADGNHLMTLGEHDRDPSVLENRAPGTYRTRVELPGNWLNLGTYYIRINSGIQALETYDLQETLSFSIVEHREQSFRQNRFGSLVPLLPWRRL